MGDGDGTGSHGQPLRMSIIHTCAYGNGRHSIVRSKSELTLELIIYTVSALFTLRTGEHGCNGRQDELCSLWLNPHPHPLALLRSITIRADLRCSC
jgi:hypothetical protein